MTNAYKILFGKLEGMGALGRPRHGWGAGLILKLSYGNKVGDVDWILVAQDRDWWWAPLSMVMDFWVT
jgi:hypothetical protein